MTRNGSIWFSTLEPHFWKNCELVALVFFQKFGFDEENKNCPYFARIYAYM